MATRCPTCGEQALSDEARFCVGCGAPLPDAQQGVVAEESFVATSLPDVAAPVVPEESFLDVVPSAAVESEPRAPDAGIAALLAQLEEPPAAPEMHPPSTPKPAPAPPEPTGPALAPAVPEESFLGVVPSAAVESEPTAADAGIAALLAQLEEPPTAPEVNPPPPPTPAPAPAPPESAGPALAPVVPRTAPRDSPRPTRATAPPVTRDLPPLRDPQPTVPVPVVVAGVVALLAILLLLLLAS